MESYDSLIKALRSASTVSTAWEKLMLDAAAAIEALQAQINGLIADAGARIGKAEAERPHWVSVFDDLPRHNAVVVVSDGKRSWDVGQYHFLIDADAPSLRGKLKMIREGEYQIYGKVSWGFAAKCETAIDNAPTIDAVPVRHGEWIHLYKNNYRCSVCGAWFVFEDENNPYEDGRFCSYCGARMGERRKV